MSIGLSELGVIAIVMILLIRPHDWPKLVRRLGYWYGRIQKMADELNNSVRSIGEINDDTESTQIDDRVSRG